jgi:diguanylate cyclase (GGDEF)-like protein
MEEEKEETLLYQEYFMAHYEEIELPVDFTEYRSYKKSFDELFSKKYQGKTLGVDIQITECDDDTQKAYFTYKHAYWTIVFEKARSAMNIHTTYYVAPPGEPLYMTYIIDCVREVKKDDPAYLNLGITVEEPLEQHRTMWEAYNTGENPHGYDVYDNEFGHTYAYYSPLIIDGEVIGVVSAEVEVDVVNKEILYNTVQQLVFLAIVLISAVMLLVAFINAHYVGRLSLLEKRVNKYSETKDIKVAKEIEQFRKGNDEITTLSEKIAIMIFELDNYMKNLVSTSDEPGKAKRKADIMNELAYKDSLTGIRNKLAYDQEAQRLSWGIAAGNAEFAIAVIDLNYLKKINDTYGHEQGNLAIKNLCTLICKTFRHSPVFRVGGDEFCVVLEKIDYNNLDTLIADFNKSIKQNEARTDADPWVAFSAAIGYACYDKEIDRDVNSVLKRADKAMYANKKAMRATRNE